MQRRRMPVLSLLALLVLVMAACTAPAAQPAAPAEGGEAAASGPQPGGTLNLSFGDDFVTFHPFYDVTNADFKPIFFEAPLRISDDGGFEPWLAESVEPAEDGLSVTIRLRQGIKFHNGREVTADDLIWSVDLARNQEIGHHLGDRFQTATGAEKIDDYTVRITYSERTASQLDAIARLYLFPQEAAETIDTVPVGTGPFKFVEWIPGDSVTAERFEDYWQEGLPYLDRVVIKAIPDVQARQVNLQSQAIDLLMYLPLSDKQAMEAEEGIIVGEAPPGFSFYAFIMNINAPPFDDVRVRQAFQYAIDREEIANTAFHGEATPLLIPYPPTSWVYPEDLENYYTHDPERARELLAEAGYPDGFSVEMLIRGTEDAHLDQAQVFQQQLAEIGVQVELLPTELPQYWPLLFESQFQIVSHKTGDATVDPSGLFEAAACCRPFRSFFGIQDRTEDWFIEYRDVINRARESNDQEERAQLYHRALEIWLEQAWTIPTVWEQDVYAYWDYVQGLRTDMDGSLWLHETWLNR
ncbi:MAG TPA: ABC transporter substrate-binding protein [Caldilineaceae bacterium]|nr:ABC transporter substrate-binding protein [Caldilineaceae bacterium]